MTNGETITVTKCTFIASETQRDVELRHAFYDIKDGKPGVPYDTGKELFKQTSLMHIIYPVFFKDDYGKKREKETGREMHIIASYFDKTLDEMQNEIHGEFEREEEEKDNVMGLWKVIYDQGTYLPTAKESNLAMKKWEEDRKDK